MESQKKHPPTFRPHPGLRLMDQVREVLRDDRYAYRTEPTDVHWIRRYLQHCGGQTHPHRRGAMDVERWLAHLAPAGPVSAST